jgi:hypothetical protein
MDNQLDEKEKLLLDIKKLREKINCVLGENDFRKTQKNQRISKPNDIDEMLNHEKKSVK